MPREPSPGPPSPEPIPVQHQCSDLHQLGVRPGDLLMLHASLRAVGPVAGRADGLLDALHQAVGPQGTLMMVLGAHDPCSCVNDRPEAEREALLRGAEPFDARRTPADPEVGALAEVFRQRPETRVSDHPEGRFGAAGRLAPQLVTDVPWHDDFGPGSPLERLLDQRGRILRLGADPDTVTALHYAEYRVGLPHKRRIRRHRRLAQGVRIVESLDDSEGIADFDGEDYFAAILRAYLATGRGDRGRVGRARSELLDARDLVDFGVAWMARHLGS